MTYYTATKYHNQRTERDGIRFDSLLERRRYDELKLLELDGQISALRVHPVYLLQEGFTYQGKKIRRIDYQADFSYLENGIEVAEDVKAFDKRSGEYITTPLFDLKRKLFLFRYPAMELRIV